MFTSTHCRKNRFMTQVWGWIELGCKTAPRPAQQPCKHQWTFWDHSTAAASEITANLDASNISISPPAPESSFTARNNDQTDPNELQSQNFLPNINRNPLVHKARLLLSPVSQVQMSFESVWVAARISCIWLGLGSDRKPFGSGSARSPLGWSLDRTKISVPLYSLQLSCPLKRFTSSSLMCHPAHQMTQKSRRISPNLLSYVFWWLKVVSGWVRGFSWWKECVTPCRQPFRKCELT